MNKKILHITSSLKIGGAESLICDILDHIKNDYNNFVIYFHGGPNVEKIKKLGIQTYQVKGAFCKYDPIFCLRLFLLIIKIKPSLIHSHLWSANLLSSLCASLLRIPIICNLHLVSNSEQKSKNNLLRGLLDKITFKLSNKLICVSDKMYKEIVLARPLFKNKIKVIQNGVDYKKITAASRQNIQLREFYNLTSEHFVIGSVGRLIERKRYDLLINQFNLALKDCSHLRLFILGSGPLENNLKKLVKKLNIQDKVIFESSNSAYGFYPLFNLFVMTSKEEGLSIALLEAMSCGKTTIIISPTLEHEVIEHEKNGFIVLENEVNGLHKMLVKLSQSYVNLENVAKATVIEKFNINCMVNKYKKIFGQLNITFERN